MKLTPQELINLSILNVIILNLILYTIQVLRHFLPSLIIIPRQVQLIILRLYSQQYALLLGLLLQDRVNSVLIHVDDLIVADAEGSKCENGEASGWQTTHNREQCPAIQS